MSEIQIFVKDKTLSFTGIFDAKNLAALAKESMKKHKYEQIDEVHDIESTKTGRNQQIKYMFSKKTTQYDTSNIHITFNFKQMIPIAVKKEYEESKQKGELTIIFYGFSLSNREGKVGYHPFSYFFNRLWRKFVKADQWDKLGSDIQDTITQVADDLHVRLHNGI